MTTPGPTSRRSEEGAAMAPSAIGSFASLSLAQAAVFASRTRSIIRRTALAPFPGCALGSTHSVGGRSGHGLRPKHGRPPTAMFYHPSGRKPLGIHWLPTTMVRCESPLRRTPCLRGCPRNPVRGSPPPRGRSPFPEAAPHGRRRPPRTHCQKLTNGRPRSKTLGKCLKRRALDGSAKQRAEGFLVTNLKEGVA